MPNLREYGSPLMATGRVLLVVVVGSLTSAPRVGAQDEGKTKWVHEGSGSADVTREQKQALDRLVAEIRVSEADVDFSNPIEKERFLKSTKARSELWRLLGEKGPEWGYVRPRLCDLARSARRRDVRERVLGLLVRDQHPHSDQAVRVVLRADPTAFHIDDVLLLDERGFERARSHIERHLKTGKRRFNQICAAVHLAMRGDDLGRGVLQWVHRDARFPRTNPARYIACSAGLRILGDEPAWSRCVNRVAQGIEQQLDNNRVSGAAQLVLWLEYFHSAVKSGKPVSVSHLNQSLTRYEYGHREEMTTADEVRERLRALRRP